MEGLPGIDNYFRDPQINQKREPAGRLHPNVNHLQDSRQLQRRAVIHRIYTFTKELFKNLNSSVETVKDFIRTNAIKDTSKESNGS